MSGDYTVGSTIYKKFTTRRFSTGAPFTLAGTPVVSAYEDDSVTQITAGITLSADFDGVTGLNHLTIVASGANGFESGKDYSLVITTGTVDSVSVVGEVVGEFSLERSAAAVDLANATDGLSALKALIDAVDNFIDTEIADIQARLPAALVGGRMDASVGAMAANVITAAALAADTGNEIADAWLDRDMSVGADSGSTTVRTPRQALRLLRNKVAISGGTMTVNKEDDATASWTAAVTGTAGADPITAIDPAGP